MNYYPLLEAPDFLGFTSLANFPPTEKMVTERVYVYSAQADGEKWQIRCLGDLPAGGLKRFQRDDKTHVPGQSIFFFMSLDSNLPSVMLELPSASSFQHATPRWRGTLGLSRFGKDVAYSGEYPDEMLPLAKSSCLSVSPLLQLNEDVRTSILFANVLRSPKLASFTATLVLASSKEVLQTFKVQTNSVSICHVSPDIAEKTKGHLCHFTVEGVTGIPIYLSYSESKGLLSLEHSHPPVEFIVFGEGPARLSFVREMKRAWF